MVDMGTCCGQVGANPGVVTHWEQYPVSEVSPALTALGDSLLYTAGVLLGN